MNKRISLLLLCCLALPLFAAKLTPEKVYSDISRRMVRQLNTHHLSGEIFNDRLSALAWTNLVNSLDYDRTLLTQEDLEHLKSHTCKIDDDLIKGDLTFGYELVDLVRGRIEERCTYVEEVLALENPFDFSKQEYFQWKRKDAERPTDRKDQRKLWYTMLKNEYLALILAQELDAEEKAQKSNQPKTETDEAETAEEEANYDIKEDLSQPPATIIAKRYRTMKEVFSEMDSETALQRILSAAAMAYDPHTDYMSPMNFEEFSMDMNLTLCGIGATLRYDDGLIRVTELMPGAPAANDTREIRLRVGDRIIGVGQGDDPIEDICHKPLSRTVRKIRGPKGTKVTLKVIPVSDKTGTRTKIVDLIRDEIRLEQQAVTGHVERLALPDGERKLGYVRIPTFYAGAVSGAEGENASSMTRDLLVYLQQFNTEHVDGLVIDLRNNGGGSLMEALSMTALFVTGPAVQVRDARSVDVHNGFGSVAFRKPIVVLVNRNSASASEIVASALQDYGRAIIVGDSKTHGKGTVQTVQPLGRPTSTYGADRITTACFYRINGGTTQLRGVEPDIVIPSIYDALELGEDQLPGALPYTTVQPAYYAKTADIQPYLKRLTDASQKRLQKDEQATSALKLIEHVRKVNAEKMVPLKMEERRARMRAERAVEKMQEEALEGLGSTRKNGPSTKNDPVMREAFQILSDFIDLRGGPDEPVNVNGDLRSRFYQIFGTY